VRLPASSEPSPATTSAPRATNGPPQPIAPRPHHDVSRGAWDRGQRPRGANVLADAGTLVDQEALVTASRDELEVFARSCRHSWSERFADRVRTALGADHFTPRNYPVRAKADTIRLAATQLLAIGAQRRAWERRMGELLLGAPRRGRAKQPREDERGQHFPGGEIYLSFPGLGDRLAARVAAEIGDHPEQFESPNALQCYAGKAPVTRRSGKNQFVVACRLAS
jgi:hypothetical protein